MVLIGISLAGIVVSAILTKARFNQSSFPPELLEHTAGTGLVPSWVSLPNMGSWVVLAIGALRLIF